MKKKLLILCCLMLVVNVTSIPVYAVTGGISVEAVERSTKRTKCKRNKRKKSKSNEDSTSKKKGNNKKGEEMPEEFTEYIKFIGKDISTLNIDASKWNSEDLVHELWDSSLYGHRGKISVRLGWDDKTITSFYFKVDEKNKLSNKDIQEVDSKLKDLFGDTIEDNDVTTTYSGKSDCEFVLPKEVKSTEKSKKSKELKESVTYTYYINWDAGSLAEFNEGDPKNATTESVTKVSPFIGMTASELEKSSWGKPADINKTTTKYGTTEQWVYRFTTKSKYIYLQNGVVTVIQE